MSFTSSPEVRVAIEVPKKFHQKAESHPQVCMDTIGHARSVMDTLNNHQKNHQSRAQHQPNSQPDDCLQDRLQLAYYQGQQDGHCQYVENFNIFQENRQFPCPIQQQPWIQHFSKDQHNGVGQIYQNAMSQNGGNQHIATLLQGYPPVANVSEYQSSQVQQDISWSKSNPHTGFTQQSFTRSPLLQTYQPANYHLVDTSQNFHPSSSCNQAFENSDRISAENHFFGELKDAGDEVSRFASNGMASASYMYPEQAATMAIPESAPNYYCAPKSRADDKLNAQCHAFISQQNYQSPLAVSNPATYSLNGTLTLGQSIPEYTREQSHAQVVQNEFVGDTHSICGEAPHGTLSIALPMNTLIAELPLHSERPVEQPNLSLYFNAGCQINHIPDTTMSAHNRARLTAQEASPTVMSKASGDFPRAQRQNHKYQSNNIVRQGPIRETMRRVESLANDRHALSQGYSLNSYPQEEYNDHRGLDQTHARSSFSVVPGLQNESPNHQQSVKHIALLVDLDLEPGNMAGNAEGRQLEGAPHSPCTSRRSVSSESTRKLRRQQLQRFMRPGRVQSTSASHASKLQKMSIRFESPNEEWLNENDIFRINDMPRDAAILLQQQHWVAGRNEPPKPTMLNDLGPLDGLSRNSGAFSSSESSLRTGTSSLLDSSNKDGPNVTAASQDLVIGPEPTTHVEGSDYRIQGPSMVKLSSSVAGHNQSSGSSDNFRIFELAENARTFDDTSSQGTIVSELIDLDNFDFGFDSNSETNLASDNNLNDHETKPSSNAPHELAKHRTQHGVKSENNNTSQSAENHGPNLRGALEYNTLNDEFDLSWFN